jgi:hypothetical protein
MDKLAALARAMGFSPALWFEEELTGADGRGAVGRPEGLAGRIGRLFDVIKDPKTGEPYTNSRIARMSLGDLAEADVEGLRSGSVTDPPLSHLLALASEMPPMTTESALPLSSGGTRRVAVARATGVQTAAKHALATLAASNRENVGAAAAAALATANRTREATRSCLLSTRVVAATKTGETRA